MPLYHHDNDVFLGGRGTRDLVLAGLAGDYDWPGSGKTHVVYSEVYKTRQDTVL